MEVKQPNTEAWSRITVASHVRNSVQKKLKKMFSINMCEKGKESYFAGDDTALSEEFRKMM